MGGAIIVLSIIIGLLLQKGCNKKKIIHLSPTMYEIDHRNEAERIAKLYTDSVQALYDKKVHEADSLKRIVQRQEGILAVKDVKLTALTKEAALNKKYKDTAAYLVNCDSAFSQIEDAAIIVRKYTEDNALLRNSLDSAIGQGSLLIARKDYEHTELQESFARVTGMADALANENQKLSKKAARKNVIGIQGGGTYFFSDNKVRPYVGIGYTRAIFSF